MDERLAGLVESIQRLNPTEYEEMFKLLHQNKCEYTRNNNGIFLNLSWLDEALLSKIELFVEFCKASRREIQHYESICKNLSQNIHDRGHASCATAVSAVTAATTGHGQVPTPLTAGGVLRSTAAMRFYLLKKKYAKNATFDVSIQRDLEKERVLL